MSKLKKYAITILGESYSLISDQNEEHVQSAADKVNEIMQEISQKAPHLEPKKAAVLTALKIASMMVACEQDLAKINKHGQDLLDHLDRELPVSLNV